MGEARRERADHSAREAWRVCACALAMAAALASCAPAPGVLTRTPPPAGAGSISGRAAPLRKWPSLDPDSLWKPEVIPTTDSLLGVWMPAMSLPRVDAAGRLDWSPRARWSADAAHARAVLRDAGDSLTGWQALAAEDRSWLGPYALRRAAYLLLARGDSLGADRVLGDLLTFMSDWEWEALRLRSDLAIAAGHTARAESLLSREPGFLWTETEVAALRMRQASLAEARGDSGLAWKRARKVFDLYPSTAAAIPAIAMLQRFADFRDQLLPAADATQAAGAARARGDRPAAMEWLERAHRASSGNVRARVDIQWARVSREARRFDAALSIIASALRSTPDAAIAAELRLERARAYRDAGRRAEALRSYGAVERETLSDDLGAAAGWEHGLELIAAGRTADARIVLRHAAHLNGDRSMDARLLCGLLWVADGEPQHAASEWQEAEGEAFAFWRAVLTRRSASVTARDSARRTLQSIAARPGYSFYRVAARDSLGVSGWPDRMVMREKNLQFLPDEQFVEALIVLGDREAAKRVMQQARGGVMKSLDARVQSPGAGIDASRASSLPRATLAFGMDQIPLAIRISQNVLDRSIEPNSSAVEWSLIALRYPPALDSLYGAVPESPGSDPVDRALLRAVAWQESRFDPRARSKSDALGLYQLKLATAGDMARRLGAGPPDREAMFDAATSLRYGREYLRWLLERFDNNWPVAVSAYNSGPSAVSPQWRTLLDRGGVALFCELIGRAETRDYVRNIMGARSAYRELRPYALSDSAAIAPR